MKIWCFGFIIHLCKIFKKKYSLCKNRENSSVTVYGSNYMCRDSTYSGETSNCFYRWHLTKSIAQTFCHQYFMSSTHWSEKRRKEDGDGDTNKWQTDEEEEWLKGEHKRRRLGNIKNSKTEGRRRNESVRRSLRDAFLQYLISQSAIKPNSAHE